MTDVRDLIVYQKAFKLAMDIYGMTRDFPKEERYALVDQMLRSSRSVTAQLAEGYRKRRYEAHFILKLTDADAENCETQTWLEYAHACGYIDQATLANFMTRSEEVGKLLGAKIRNPDKYSERKGPTNANR
jgi:four helix bundle protein